MTAFSAALGAIFADPNMAVDALWRAGGTGEGVALRVIREAPDEIATFGNSRFAAETLRLEVRIAEAPTLASGDSIEIEGTSYRIEGEPRRDAEGLLWQCEARPAE